MVADCDGVVADEIHGDCVVVRDAFLETRLELCAGQVVVPRGEHQRDVVPSPVTLLLQLVDHGGERCHTPERLLAEDRVLDGGLQQRRLSVVVVDQCQGHVRSRLGIGARLRRAAGTAGDREQSEDDENQGVVDPPGLFRTSHGIPLVSGSGSPRGRSRRSFPRAAKSETATATCRQGRRARPGARRGSEADRWGRPPS